MKMRLALPVAVMVLGLSLVLVSLGSASPPSGDPGTPARVICSLVPAINADYEFTGSNKCKKCHIKEHKSWEKTKMGQALETLKPGAAAEIKTKFGLDPQKDYTTDEKCLACHTTGYGKPGGYAIPAAGDEKAAKAAKNLAGGGCETCHGAAGKYIDIFEDIFKSKRKYKVDELHAAGMTKIDAATCTQCHNDKSPTFDATKPFDFEKMKDQDRHEKVELKQREG